MRPQMRGIQMFIGHGELVLRGGVRLPLHYEYIETSDSGRTGRLALDVSLLDSAAFFESMELHCADGVAMLIAVTDRSDRNISFVGRVIEPEV